MRLTTFISIAGCFLIVLITHLSFAQNIKITLGPEEIGENQAWTITVTVQNEQLKSYDNFPDIDGFRKRGTSTQSSTSIINGQISSSHSVVMTYLPSRQGIFTIAPFKMKINGLVIDVPGKKVKIGAPVQAQRRDPFSGFFDQGDDFFDKGETEFVDIKDNAILALTTSKDEVYVGEGFNASLSFLVAQNNEAPLSFYELGKQLAEILKRFKPANCWEENFNIENIEGENVTINDKDYTQYKIYQATFYPLNAEPIKFPGVGLKMIKYKVAKNPTFFGQNRQEDFKTFFSKAKTVNVKKLPPHPLGDAVAVGDYYLEEEIGHTTLKTGQSVSYEFNIYGEGNISAIAKPTVLKDGNFEFYEPNVRQNINRQHNKVTGTKSFNYFMIPHEPGTYSLGDYFQWVFFNPAKHIYDTLRPKVKITVEGESRKNEAIQSTDPGTFYDRAETADNSLQTMSDPGWQRTTFNIFIMLVIAASAYLVVKKPS